MTKKIHILFLTTRRQVEIAFPLIRWKKQLSNEGFNVIVSDRWKWGKGTKSIFDLVILSNPYCKKWKSSNETTKERILKEIRDSEGHRRKIALFDTRDGPASNYLDLLPKLDLLLKKQIYKDIDFYSDKNYSTEHSAWLGEKTNLLPNADPAELSKISVGWNIALSDYSEYRKPRKLLHWYGYFWPLRYTKAARRRPYLSSFRGGISGARKTHREAAIECMQFMRHESILLGPKVSRWKYLKELRQSKTIVSPYGYGEICYRDMETFISGAILIKPVMEHLETFPPLYEPWKTYIPVKLDYSDLPEVLLDIEGDYKRYLPIAEEGQRRYRE